MAKKAKKAKRPARKMNAPKFRTVKASSGWMRADAIRFVKRRGKPLQVLVRRRKARAKR